MAILVAAILYFCSSFLTIYGNTDYSCPILYGGGDPSDVDLQGFRLYINLNDPELRAVASSLILFSADGIVDIVKDGMIAATLFKDLSFVRELPSLQSNMVPVIPLHIETSKKIYYSFSSISPNDTVLGPYNHVSPNAQLAIPGEIKNFTISFCCKEDGSVILQGCLTLSNEPFQLYNGSYVTIGPFYTGYQCTNVSESSASACADNSVQEPPLTKTSVKVEMCFPTNQSQALINSGIKGWSQIGFANTMFCGIDSDEDHDIIAGVNGFFVTPEKSEVLPIGFNFTMLQFEYLRSYNYTWTSPTYYSLSLDSNDSSVLGPSNATVPFQGTFNQSEYVFTVFFNCLKNGETTLTLRLNTSGVIAGYVFNNSYTAYFHKVCTTVNTTTNVNGGQNLAIILPVGILLPLVVIIAVIIISVLMVLCIVRKRKQVQVLEQIVVNNVEKSSNTYAFLTVTNHFDFIDGHENLEYNYAAIELVEKIGEGFFGKVYKAKTPGLCRGDQEVGDFTAIKTLKDDSDMNDLADFAKEMKICMQFDHPNVIKLLGVCTTSITKCMIFEFMDQGSLDHCLRYSNPEGEDYDPASFHLSKDNFLHIVLQLAMGLEYLASLKFVHRDIATRNCLINTKLVTKIADFGLSRNLNAQNYYRVGGGKKSYLPIRWMPPEAILYGKFTVKSDVWSFGILMWEVYTFGQQPYPGLSNHEVIDYIKDNRIMDCPPNYCPVGVYEIMKSSWNRIPSHRPAMSEIVHKLDLLTKGETSHSTT